MDIVQYHPAPVNHCRTITHH